MTLTGTNWIRFLRQHGPRPRNDTMYDEQIHRVAHRLGIQPLSFVHPGEAPLLAAFSEDAKAPVSVVLTGTAGDGKTHLCGKVWRHVDGDLQAWDSDETYFTKPILVAGRPVTLHLLRDLTALPPSDDQGRYSTREGLLQRLAKSLTKPAATDVFLIAANDGQLLDAWAKACSDPDAARAREVFERLLVEERSVEAGWPLFLLNLSRQPSAVLFDLALSAFVAHAGWTACYAEANPEGFFGDRCPIRRNFELLREPVVQTRLRNLFELCDQADLHIPIRRILLLLANAVLGHPDVGDRLMQPADVPKLIAANTTGKASLYSNIFGGNLTETKRDSLEIFEYLNRFRIGHETSNRIDNILIFGAADDSLRPAFDRLVASDSYYGATPEYQAAQAAYVETSGDDDSSAAPFLSTLVSQRRRLFFTIPDEVVEEYRLWDLTIFQYAGEYLDRLLSPLRRGAPVERAILSRLVRGLNRVFTGLLTTTDRELLLATSLSYSGARVSQVLDDRVPVSPRLHERIDLTLQGDRPGLTVWLAPTAHRTMRLNLVRYEFLSRVAEGALPGSFSRECYEDILAFKSQVLAGLAQRRQTEPSRGPQPLFLRLLELDPAGNAVDRPVEVLNV